MVLERTLNNLRERPKEERTAIAAWIAISVVALLFICWAIYFLHGIRNTPAPDLQNVTASLDQSGLQAAQQAYGSSTQFIETQGSMQLVQTGTSSESQ